MFVVARLMSLLVLGLGFRVPLITLLTNTIGARSGVGVGRKRRAFASAHFPRHSQLREKRNKTKHTHTHTHKKTKKEEEERKVVGAKTDVYC